VPIQVTCQSCRGAFNAPDNAGGKRAKCPTCGSVIQIPAHAVAAVVDAEVDPAGVYGNDFSVDAPAAIAAGEERKQCPMCGETIAAKAIKCRFCGELLDASLRGMIQSAGDVGDPGWRRVRTGLATIYYCIVTIAAILMGISIVAGLALSGGQDFDDLPVFSIVVIAIGVLVILGAALGILIGEIMCLYVPEISGAKGFVIGALVCMAANFMISVLGGVAQMPAAGSLGNLISMAGHILFILFIRQSATYLGDQKLADSAFRFLMFLVLAFVGIVGMALIAGMAGAAVILGVLIILGILCGIVYFLWYLKLIRSLMTTIDQRTSVR
jgi:predicted RNA-binding Zn-ribbon protein involved in translation (DUF1610 family)